MANPVVTRNIDKVAQICALSPEQEQVWREVTESCTKPDEVARLGASLLAARRFRFVLYGRPGAGKTRSLRKLGEALGAPIRYLSADDDTVTSPGLDPVSVSVATPRDTDPSAQDLLTLILEQVQGLKKEVAVAARDGRKGLVSGVFHDSLTSWSGRLWEIFSDLETAAKLEELAKKNTDRVAGALQMSSSRMSGAAAGMIKQAGFRVFRAFDGHPLTDAWAAPGPVVCGFIAHAKSRPELDYNKEPIMGSHQDWVLQLGRATARDAQMITDFSLGYCLGKGPDEPIKKRTFEWDTLKYAHCKARLADGDDAEVKIIKKCAETCDLAGLVTGLYAHRIDRAISALKDKK